MTETAGVAIVGLGAAGRQHLQALADCSAGTVRAVCDSDKLLAKRAAERTPATRALDWDDVLAAPDIDVVSLCTPPESHHMFAAAALSAGKAVLVEKPPVRTEAELDALLVLADATGRPAGVMLQHRFRLPDTVRDGVWSGRAVGVIEVVRHRPAEHYARAPWRLDPATSAGGLFPHLAVHYADLACQMLGVPVEVTGSVDCETVPGIDSRLALSIRFDSGATATLIGSTGVDERGERLAVYDDGRLLTVHDGVFTLRRHGGHETVPAAPTATLRTAVYAEFCHAVVTGSAPRRTALAHSRGVVRMLEHVGRLAR